MKSHVVITRMHYPEGSEEFEWRLHFFAGVVLPRILDQTVKDFDIAVRCNPLHAERIEALHQRVMAFWVKPEAEGRIQDKDKIIAREYFADYVPWDDVIGLWQYDIQTAIDSDDLVRPDFLERIEAEVEKATGSLHISFQPYLYNLRTLTTYHSPWQYTETSGSMFLSLYQPDKTRYKFIYEDTHRLMHKHAERSIVVPEGYCWQMITGHNEDTTMPPGAKPL